MAVVQTGTPVNINASSDSSSQSITVPSDAELMVVFYAGYESAGSYTSSEVALTIGGASLTHIIANGAGSGTNGCFVQYRVSPATGSQTFAWTISSGYSYGHAFVIAFYKGVDITSPILDSDSTYTDVGTSATTPTMTVNTGDMMVGGLALDNSPTVTGSSQTQVGSIGLGTKGGTVHLGVAERASASSFTASFAATSFAGLVAIVIAQASETGTLNQHSFRFFNDDGSESAATAKDALNTNINLSASNVARIRFLIDATNDPTERQFRLEYRRKPSGGSFGSWEKVN